MIVEFEDGVIKTYKINEQENTYSLFWTLDIKPTVKIEGGKNIKAEEVTVKEEEKIMEEGQINPEKEM